MRPTNVAPLFACSLLAIMVTSAAGCATAPPPPPLAAEVHTGPAGAAAPRRVLVLHAVCGSVEYPCPKEYGQTVDAIVRGGLEFAGYGVVDDQTLRKETRSRHEERVESNDSSASQSRHDVQRDLSPFDTHVTEQGQRASHSETTTVVLDGPGFEDLSVDERHDVVVRSGAEAVASVRIVVGGQVGIWTPNQNVEVQVKLAVDRGDTLAWASRCSASSNQFSTVTAALENAARCAVHGGAAGR